MVHLFINRVYLFNIDPQEIDKKMLDAVLRENGEKKEKSQKNEKN